MVFHFVLFLLCNHEKEWELYVIWSQISSGHLFPHFGTFTGPTAELAWKQFPFQALVEPERTSTSTGARVSHCVQSLAWCGVWQLPNSRPQPRRCLLREELAPVEAELPIMHPELALEPEAKLSAHHLPDYNRGRCSVLFWLLFLAITGNNTSMDLNLHFDSSLQFRLTGRDSIRVNGHLSPNAPQTKPSQQLLTCVFFAFPRQDLQLQLQELSAKGKRCWLMRVDLQGHLSSRMTLAEQSPEGQARGRVSVSKTWGEIFLTTKFSSIVFFLGNKF